MLISKTGVQQDYYICQINQSHLVSLKKTITYECLKKSIVCSYSSLYILNFATCCIKSLKSKISQINYQYNNQRLLQLSLETYININIGISKKKDCLGTLPQSVHFLKDFIHSFNRLESPFHRMFFVSWVKFCPKV